MSVKYAIIDVETTGGRAERDRITEIAIVVFDGQKVIKSFETLINPECPIPYGITELTGITNEMVADAPRFYEVAREIVEYTEGAVFVAHNVRFDYGFLREEFKRLGYTFSRKQLCTVRLSRQTFPGLSSYSLGNLIRHFSIVVENRHRAMADTMATLDVLTRILQKQEGGTFARDLINLGIRESKLPHGLNLEFLHRLPEACGVYYFHDDSGNVVYIGKSLNIRKRVMEHFADQTRKAALLQAQVRDITFEITGSELVALLLESHEIKRLNPSINRTQRQKSFPFVIHSFHNSQGYICFEVKRLTNKEKNGLHILNEFTKINHARGSLFRMQKELGLCSKLIHLENGGGPCFEYHLKECAGACIGEEAPESYNEKASIALEKLSNLLNGSFFILDEGRSKGEKAVVSVIEGEYAGFGFFDEEFSEGSLDELADCIRPYSSNPEVKRIIRHSLNDNPKLKIISAVTTT